MESSAASLVHLCFVFWVPVECWIVSGLKALLQGLNSLSAAVHLPKNKKVQRYPGFHSVWILDGAKIHCDRHIVKYLRIIGILPIFLPAYCPFFNPLEVVFGLIKKDLQRQHRQNVPVMHEVLDAVNRFKIYPCLRLFEQLLPEKGIGQDPKQFGLNILP